ncbi:hypothetical protein QEH56_16240 [Pelagicoccus enzymogenes]|uniref:hypothetical protein n=1 Tax=Pelagicoccus enzymogenes TaxID=2773457 RepID=UPI00280E43F1|nr:hypothetical protein [Pelagicoccus enzymogenes]MDQ8199713.1 hypothetical protein [Pelagicoccus enzymogenes]
MIQHPSSRRPTIRLFAVFAAILLPTWLLEAKPKSNSASEAPTQHFLFEGSEILASFDGEFHRVVGADRNSLALQTESGIQTVPIRQIQGYLTKRGMKTSALWANIDKIRASSQRVAYNKEMAELQLGTASSIRRREAELELEKGELLISQATLGRRASDAARESKIADESDQIENLRDVIDEYSKERAADLEQGDGHKAVPASALNLPFDYDYDPLADGLQIKCVISSPDSIEDAFLTVTCRYLDVRQHRKVVEAFELKPIGALGKKPQKVTVQLRNLPTGFQLIECLIDLYGNGAELATNLSPKLETLSEEQLYQHFLASYLTQNRGATRPPQIVLLAQPGDMQKQLTPAELQQDIHAEIDKNGQVISLAADDSATREIAPRVSAALRFVRFFPSLENGEPIDGLITFKLSVLLQQKGRQAKSKLNKETKSQ